MRACRSYRHEFTLPAEPGEVFRLFSDPKRLNQLTPNWFDLRPKAAFAEPLTVGERIQYRLRWRGIPLVWTSRIVEWEPPRKLTYEQERGPYSWFRHEHCFEPAGEGTRVVDRVLFRAPGGSLVERGLVEPDLRRIFRHRAEAARRILAPREAAVAKPGLAG